MPHPTPSRRRLLQRAAQRAGLRGLVGADAR